MSWQTRNNFPKKLVKCFPFERNNKIIYSTRYDPKNENKSGIFEYDAKNDKHKPLKLWKNTNYYPEDYTLIYNKTQDEIIFVGAKNVKKNNDEYKKIIFIYKRIF